MAWLSNLTEKAEGLLVRLDQNAAKVLTANGDINRLSEEDTFLTDSNLTQTESTSSVSSKDSESLHDIQYNSLQPLESYSINVESSHDDLYTPRNLNSHFETIMNPEIASYDISVASSKKESSPICSVESQIIDTEIKHVVLPLEEIEDVNPAALKPLLYEQTEESHSDVDWSHLFNTESKEQETEQDRQLFPKRDEILKSIEQLAEYCSNLETELNQTWRMFLRCERNNENLNVQLGLVTKFIQDTSDEVKLFRMNTLKALEDGGVLVADSAFKSIGSKKNTDSWEVKYLELKEQAERIEEIMLKAKWELAYTVQCLTSNDLRYKETLKDVEGNRKAAEDKCNALQKELSYLQNKITLLEQQLEGKEQDLNDLQRQCRSFAVKDDAVETLNEILIKKQNSLEEAIAERNALKLELTMLKQSYDSEMKQVRLELEGVKKRTFESDSVPHFVWTSSSDASVTRRVKKVYSTVDAFGMRLGVFLRRYPVMRAFVIFYMILLHIWVAFILVTCAENPLTFILFKGVVVVRCVYIFY